jgi:hypothetical protein
VNIDSLSSMKVNRESPEASFSQSLMQSQNIFVNAPHGSMNARKVIAAPDEETKIVVSLILPTHLGQIWNFHAYPKNQAFPSYQKEVEGELNVPENVIINLAKNDPGTKIYAESKVIAGTITDLFIRSELSPPEPPPAYTPPHE